MCFDGPHFETLTPVQVAVADFVDRLGDVEQRALLRELRKRSAPRGERLSAADAPSALAKLIARGGRDAIPPAASNWTAAQWSRFEATLGLIKRFAAVAASMPGESFASHVAAFRKKHGGWARSHGLRTSGKSILRYLERCDPQSARFDGNIDGRGRPRSESSGGTGKARPVGERIITAPDSAGGYFDSSGGDGETSPNGEWMRRDPISAGGIFIAQDEALGRASKRPLPCGCGSVLSGVLSEGEAGE